MWLKELKIAVIQKNVEQVEKTLYLLEEAKSIVQGLKDETAESMAQMKKNIDFLNSATADKTAKFDITS